MGGFATQSWAAGSSSGAARGTLGPARSTLGAVRGTREHVSGVFGRRYCELLLLYRSSPGFVAHVYNTFGLNNCPPAAWRAIDTTAVAQATHSLAVVRNGPRFWLMNQIEKVQRGPRIV